MGEEGIGKHFFSVDSIYFRLCNFLLHIFLHPFKM